MAYWQKSGIESGLIGIKSKWQVSYFYTMKHLPLLIIFSIYFSATLNAQSFRVAFIQDGHVVLPEQKGTVNLKRSPFEIRVELDSLDGIFVNCSESPRLKYLVQKNDVPDFQNIVWKVSVETEFNQDHELFIQNLDSYCYWFYDPKLDWHRFDSTAVYENGRVQAQKSIHQFYDIEKKTKLSIKEAPEVLHLSTFSIKGSFKDKTAELDQYSNFKLIFED
jgi:hypothetical protein